MTVRAAASSASSRSGRSTVGSCGRTIASGEVSVAADGRSSTFHTPPCVAVPLLVIRRRDRYVWQA